MTNLWFKKHGERDYAKTGENRLVFFQLPGPIRRIGERIHGPQVDFEALEQAENLPKEYTHGQMPLENRVQELEAESARTGIAALLNEGDVSEKLSQAKTALDQIKAPVTNPDELYESVLDVKHFDRLLNRLREPDLDQMDLGTLLDAELGIRAFLKPKLVQKLERSLSRMVTADAALSQINQPDIENMAWNGVEDEERRISKYLQDESKWPKGMAPGFRELAEKGLDPENRKNRMHRHRSLAEKLNAPLLADRLDYEEKLQVTYLLLEAREIKMDRIRAYLRQHYDAIKARYEAKKSLLDAEDRAACDHELRLGEKWFDGMLKDAEACKDLNARLDIVKHHLNEMFGEMENAQENQPAVIAKIREQFSVLKKQMEALTPERIAALQAKADEDERKGLAWLASANLPAYFEQFERDKLGRPEELSAEELLQISERHQMFHNASGKYGDQFSRKVDEAAHPENLADARKAHLVIQKIAHAANVSQIKEALAIFGPIADARNAGEIERILLERKSHVITVTHADFESLYGRYTETGNMVFYQRRDHWAVILDKEMIENPRGLAKLQKQLAHEFRHLEFEKNSELLAAQMEIYRSNPNWEAIKQEYVKAFPAKTPPDFKGEPKTNYTVADWTEEAIASELYAMEDDLKTVFNESPLGRLNKMLTGVGAGLIGLPEENVARIHGAEEAHGAAGGHEEPESRDADHGIASDDASVEGAYKGYLDDIFLRENEINELIHSEYVNYMPGVPGLLQELKKYLEDTKRLNDQMRQRKSQYLKRAITERINLLKESTLEINKKLSEAASNIPNEKIGVLQRIWNATSFLSIADILQEAKDIYEYFKRQHERKKGENAAKLGMALCGNTDLARESKAQYYKAEEHEVEEWKKRYEHLDAWELLELIDGLSGSPFPSKHQLKAILRVLADKGRIDWRHKGLWEALNKLQTAVHFTPEDPVLLHNPPLMRQKLHTALGKIWDYDEFLKLERNNESKYESSKKEFEPEMDSIQDQLSERLEGLLRQHRDTKPHSRVSAQEYEEIIEYAILKGKSCAEDAMFFLIIGMVEGILRPDRGMVLDKHLNNWPGTQWIYHKKPPLTRADYETYANKYFHDDFKKGKVGWSFKNFYMTHIVNDEMYVQRVRKSVSERGWDHDWSRTIVAAGEASTIKRWLQGRSGQEEVKDTAIENGMVGLLMALEENARVASQIDFRRHFRRMIGAAAMADSILNNVCPHEPGAARFTRMKLSISNAKAREVGISHHADWNVGQHIDKMKSFISLFDPVLFGPELLRNEYRASHDPDGLAVDIREYLIKTYPSKQPTWRNIKTLWDVFQKMEEIIDSVTGQCSDTDYLNYIQTLRHGLDESEYH